MRTVPLVISVNSLFLNFKKLPSSSSPCPSSSSLSRFTDEPSLSHPSRTGLCKASQVVELFPTVSPGIVVREARLIALVLGSPVPTGCQKTCLVAMIGSSDEDAFFLGSGGDFDGKLSLNKGYVVGILTLDTLADFLPRKGPLRQRRTGIAYVSNVAVRERFRRKGIAKRLITKAEVQAQSWGCRAIALHCELNNPGAIGLYKGQGFKCVKVPEGAKWPQPKTAPGIDFTFMLKLLNTKTT